MGMAERIKSRRLALKMTQEELAEKLGVQKSAIAKYENGRVRNIKRSMIEKMSDVLECDPAWLMALDNSEPSVEQQLMKIAEDKQTIEAFWKLSEANQQTIRLMIYALLANQNKDK